MDIIYTTDESDIGSVVAYLLYFTLILYYDYKKYNWCANKLHSYAVILQPIQ